MSARLLHVFSTFAPGGPQVRTCRLLPALSRKWKHAILALDGCTEARSLLAPELEVEVLPAPPRAGTPRTAWALMQLLRTRKPDLLLTYNFGALDALLAARALGLRAVVHHEDGFRPDEVASFKRRRVWARRLLLPGTRALVVPSYRLEALALGMWHVPRARLVRIPNGLSVADFPARDGGRERRAELGIPLAARVVGYVGHLRPEKAPQRALEAFALLARPDAHLLVLGDGPERPGLQARARALGLESRVHLVGHRADPRADYRAMDAFVISSDTEQMPVALLEAMACELPVASTDVGDVARILPARQAPFVVPREVPGAPPSRLSAALLRLLEERELAHDLGRENRARVSAEFSFEGMVQAYQRVYSSSLGGAPRPL